VVTSADLVQKFEAVWTPEQLESHLKAGAIVDRLRAQPSSAQRLGARRPALTESELQRGSSMISRKRAHDLRAAIAAVQPNNGNPHTNRGRETRG